MAFDRVNTLLARPLKVPGFSRVFLPFWWHYKIYDFVNYDLMNLNTLCVSMYDYTRGICEMEM